jgi:hypothetical protein
LRAGKRRFIKRKKEEKKRKKRRTKKSVIGRREGAWMMLVPVVQLIEAVDEVNVPRHAHCAVAQDLEEQQQKNK